MSKDKESPLELDDILSFVLFLAAIAFLAYVLVRTISTIQLQAPNSDKEVSEVTVIGGDICAGENEESP